jgi:hypothetical protein
MAEVEVTTTDGRRWVVDDVKLRLPDNLTPTEEVRAAADKLLAADGMVEVHADLLGSWLDWAHKEQGGCCEMYASLCNEHEKALAVARHVLGRESSDGRG